MAFKFNLGNFGDQLSADEVSKAYSTAGGDPNDFGFTTQQATDTEIAGPAKTAASVAGLSEQTARLTQQGLDAAQADEQERKKKLLSTAASLVGAYFTGGASLAAGAGGAGAASGAGGGMLGGLLGGVLGGGKK